MLESRWVRLRRAVGSEAFVLLVLAAFGLMFVAARDGTELYPDPDESSESVVVLSGKLTADWDRVRVVFRTAATLPPEERAGYVDQVLADNSWDPADVDRIQKSKGWLPDVVFPPGAYEPQTAGKR